jgi:hypothetical protein
VAAGVVCVVALGLAPVQAGQLTLSWIDNSDNEDGFAIERRQGPASAYAEIARVGPNSAGYVDVALDDGVEYCYRVRAFNGAGYSDYSNEACAVTAATLVSLVVVRDGEGAGTVSSTPSGIACGSDCSEAYPSGTAVTLTAAPASGSTFGGWSGGGCTGTAPCLLTVSQNTVVTATFALLTPPTSDTGALPSSSATLRVRVRGAGTVSSAPAGIRCPDDCQEAYPTGTTVTLTAAPAPGARFAGWGGACQGQASACTVTLGGLTEVRAKFSRLRASF